MCGLAGFWSHRLPEQAQRLLVSMGDAIAHRGPDDSGEWLDRESGIGLAHRRLSIVDLSAAGHQPMSSPGGRYVIAFNGEIYNHAELRAAVPDIRWRGTSDTESLLAAIESFGLEGALGRCVGMFAFALWDRDERCLVLARDRLGEKPLYYGWQDDALLFGSELKALKAHPAFRGEVDRDAITLLLRYNCIPSPHSIYRGVRKLPPATFLRIRTAMPFSGALPEPTPYWSLRGAAAAGQADPLVGDEHDMVDALEACLRRAVGRQMIADVPLGAFLSGGIDSSAVVALMQSQSSEAIKTFTIGFDETNYDEAAHAKAVARHLGTDHSELYVTSSEARAVIPALPSIYDEPFSDSSQIPSLLVSRLARQQVKVSLSGDGGDELFGGYNRHFAAGAAWRCATRIPAPLRGALAAGISAIPAAAWDAVYRAAAPALPRSMHAVRPGEKAHKLAQVIGAAGPADVYLQLVSHWKKPGSLVLGGSEPESPARDPSLWDAVFPFESSMMLIDAISYLPDDVLAKVDRAAMSVNLETRVPYLDHQVVELAWRLPLNMKIRDGQGKWALRQVLLRHVPAKLVERPKMGFGVPLDSWLRGSLRDWAETLLDESRLRREGFFEPAPIRRLWESHLSGKRNWQHHLWDVLMFQAWLENADVRT